MTEQKNFTVFISLFAGNLASIMNAPEEAYNLTVSYIRICGAGAGITFSYRSCNTVFDNCTNNNVLHLPVCLEEKAK